MLNAERANGLVDHRDDYKEAKETCNRLYKEYGATAGCGHATIHPQQQVRQRPNQQFEGHEEDSYRLDSSTGWRYYVPATMNSSKRQTACGQHGTGSLHHGVKQLFFSFQMRDFACRKCSFSAIDGGVTHVFLMRTACHSLLSR